MARQNRVSNGSRPRMGNLGRVKAATSNRERTLRLCQSGLLFCTSVGAILLHKFFAGTPQSSDFSFKWRCLLLHRISKWILTQKTLKFITSLKTWSTTSLDDDQADLFASLSLSTQPPSLGPTKKRQPNIRRWMLAKNSKELRRTDSKAKIFRSQTVIRYYL